MSKVKMTAAGIGIYLFFASLCGAQTIKFFPVASPDQSVSFVVMLTDRGEEKGCLIYNLFYKNDAVIGDSRLGFEMKDAPALKNHFVYADSKQEIHDDVFTPIYGERKTSANHYNEAQIDFRESDKPNRLLRIRVRSYNEGAAFRYEFPEQPELKDFTIASELTQFNLFFNFMMYQEHGTEGEYSRLQISSASSECETPLTIEMGIDPVMCIMEAQLDNYSLMRLSPVKGLSHALAADLAGPVNAAPPFASPWRVILLGDKHGDLIERSDFLLKLNPPIALKDSSWIKPGKVIRCTQLNTEGGKEYIDFAEKHKIDYVHFDAGWYGPEWEKDSDARKPKEDLDLPFLIDYAKKRHIGISLYVNRNALMTQLDEILPLYRKWGVKAVKFGFVEVGSQAAMRWLAEAVKKAADCLLMVDIHDAYRPSGLSRTYPNLMTQEGVRGNEHMPAAGHDAILPFTRFPAGAADHTICYYTNRMKTTRAHQLAASVVYYSPLQFLFWYDKPSDFQGDPEMEFFENLKTVWDETKVIQGRIGDYAAVARQSGQEWFVGCITDENARVLDIPLTFLTQDAKYVAHIYSDGDEKDGTKVKIERYLVDSATVIQAKMAASGGCAMRIVPAAAADSKSWRQYVNPDFSR
ncbi:MAG: glycoside hydrolase family 97 catalytic domain-containing protein [Candidatus Omnitrophota bacterium]